MIQFLTIAEFEAHPYYDISLEEKNMYKQQYVLQCIGKAIDIADLFSGFKLSKMEDAEWEQLDQQQLKTALVVQAQHLLRNGVEVMRANGSYSLGSMSLSTTNPEDPFFIVPELSITLKRMNLAGVQYIDNYSRQRNQPAITADEGQDKFPTWYDLKYKFPQFTAFESSDNSIVYNTTTTPLAPKVNIGINTDMFTSEDDTILITYHNNKLDFIIQPTYSEMFTNTIAALQAEVDNLKTRVLALENK